MATSSYVPIPNSNGEVLSDLRAAKLFPLNSEYELSVQTWLWDKLRDQNLECQILFNWVQESARAFKDYSSRIWTSSNRSYGNIVSNSTHQAWLEKVFNFPSTLDCTCVGCTVSHENLDPNISEVSGNILLFRLKIFKK